LNRIERLLRHREAEERIRETQQGLGRPIISAKWNGQQVVAVKNQLFFSPKWRTFPDFLSDYLKNILDPVWGNAEIAKPLAERHPIMQWYDALCRYQAATIKEPGQVHTAEVTGLVACYIGLAYSLYLIAHNVELQERLIRRLKDPANFQGAYYELIVANILIRAGFTLTLEDETDPHSKHCEFRAVSSRTGKEYSVEAKMRSVSGFLGKTDADGGKDGKLLARLGQHVKRSLAKPAESGRIIFVDLNVPQDLDEKGKPVWVEPAMRRIERLEREDLPQGMTAYVFVTNVAFHRDLDGVAKIAAAPIGLGMPEFARPGEVKVVDAYRSKQKHVDAHMIGEAFSKYASFPATFDGKLPSEAFGRASGRVLIGETYDFDGLVGTVTAALVIEEKKELVLGVTGADGRSHLIRGPMADAELADYKAHPDAYFGRVVRPAKGAKDPFDLFEWFMDVYKDLPREKLVERLSRAIHPEKLAAMSNEELLMAYSEGYVVSVLAMDNKRGAEKKEPSPT
jgi:hypothetical protein